MRSILSKLMTGSAVAGAALLVAACGGTESVNSSNTVVTDMNDMGMMDGTTDNMTGVDGAMGNDMMMSNDTMMNNMSTMNDTMSNDMMMNNAS